MTFSQIKARVIECLTGDVRRQAEEAQAEEMAAHLQFDTANAKYKRAEKLADTLEEMDRRNHYSEALTKSYRRAERTI